jgi:hypothetical protein
MTSTANGKSYHCGRLETPTLAALREQSRAVRTAYRGNIRVLERVANVQALHLEAENTHAMFQVASQFNLLEMVSPSVTPESGVARYEHDLTQGPACAIAAGAGTIYRNYFVEVQGEMGQTADRQIDCLQGMGEALGNHNERLWRMRNGYALPSESGLAHVAQQLATKGEADIDRLRSLLRIGLQLDTEVTLADSGLQVSQAYCSALPVAYTALPTKQWEPFAKLILEAAYEATFCAALLNLASHGNNKLYLTRIGGGVFGNDERWINGAIERAIELYADCALEVSLVAYGAANPANRALLRG